MPLSTDQPLSTEAETAAPASAPAASKSDLPVIDIYPHRGWQMIPLAELWAFRDLLWLMALRDVTVRYKQTALGILWAVIQPLLSMVVLNVVFGRASGMEDKVREQLGFAVAYPVFLFAGLVPWQFFSSAVTATSNSLVNNANMLRKIYFPRLVMPLSSVGAPMADYGLSFLVLLGLMFWYHVPFTFKLVLVPLLIFSTMLAALGVGLLLSAFTVSYRDFRFVVPFMLQIWFFLSPVIYPVKFFGPRYQWLLSLNPMGGTIEALRAVVLGTPVPYGAWAVSAGVSVVLLLLALIYFSRVERRFADVV